MKRSIKRAVEKLGIWLNSKDGKAHARRVFKETETALKEYRELQRVDPEKLRKPVDI